MLTSTVTAAKLAALAALGPVTGPLVWLAHHYAARGQWGRVGLTLTLLGVWYIAAPALLVFLSNQALHYHARL